MLDKLLKEAVLNWLSDLDQEILLDKHETLYANTNDSNTLKNISNLGIGDNIDLTITTNEKLFNDCFIELKNCWGINLPKSDIIVTSGKFKIIDIVNSDGITRYLIEPLEDNKQVTNTVVQKYCQDILKNTNYSFKEWRENIWTN